MSDQPNGADAPEQFAIGISFGNSNSSIAHISGEDKVEVIANEEGDRQIPTILSYVEGEEYHGTQAKAQLVRNSKNTIAYFRDYLGKDFKSIDPTPCHNSAHPVQNGSTIAFEIQDRPDEEAHNVAINEIATRHVRRLKTSASDFSGKTVTSAVIAIPTDTSEEQKTALTQVAQDAAVQVLQFIPEPVAALSAYDARSTDTADKVVVVADFGGTRSDVTVVASRDGLYSILSTAHDYDVGGAKLDQVLMDHFAKEFIKKHKTDPRTNDRSSAKLKLEAEAVKKALSQSSSATFSVESLADGVDFRSTINRTRYDMIALNVFRQFTRLIEEAVRKADLDLLDVDQVVMAGGTSNTPKIASNVQSLFPESTTVLAPSTSTTAINPSELSVRGAALQASLIQEFEKDDIDQSTHEMVTITPHLQDAIGVQLKSQNSTSFDLIVPPDSAVPVRRTKTIKAPAGDVLVTVCEGEREIKVTQSDVKPKQNGNKSDEQDDSDPDDDEDEPEEIRERLWKVKKPLAEFAFHHLKKGAKIEVTVNVGADLVLSVTARAAGQKGGVRGQIQKAEVVQNGKA